MRPNGFPVRALHLAASLAAAALIAAPDRAAGEPLASTTAGDLRAPIVSVAGRALILTPGALYRFQPDAEAWTPLGPEDGLPVPPFGGLCLSDDVLWVCGVGASFSDPEFDDWQRYAPGEGYPGSMIHDIEADEDYAYAGTDAGAARFDRYVLEWETLTGPPQQRLGPVDDVAVGEDRVWFALNDGVAEYRKQGESFRIDTTLGPLSAPAVRALRQGSRHVWAITASGLGRYDKDLETWTAYLPGIDIPDARIHQATLQGEDLWLGTDEGLWHFRDASGIWRRHEASDGLPGRRVFSFAFDQGLWVVTEQAFAFYDEEDARWIDFTTSVPIPPAEDVDLAWVAGALLLRAPGALVYGLRNLQSNPALFTYRSREVARPAPSGPAAAGTWRPQLDDAGLGLRKSAEEYLLLKGGATVYIEDDGAGGPEGLVHETRTDLTLSGRLPGGRALSGLYDTTDPDDDVYLLSFRGTRSDNLRNVSAGEVDQQFFNSTLMPGTGLRGGWVRAEAGPRSDATRRRLVTADGWAGERRTFRGRKIFSGAQEVYPGAIYKLGPRNLIKDSEVIKVDREVLRSADYTIDWEGGIFALAEHVLVDDDTTIEVTYRYEATGAVAAQNLYAGQLGLAPNDLLFVGLSGSAWDAACGRRAAMAGGNLRLEYRGRESLLQLSPEMAFSRLTTGSGSAGATNGSAAAVALRGRHRGFEVVATQRNLGGDFVSLENRSTLLGRLREESRVGARWDLGPLLQGTLDWDRVVSDSVGTAAGGRGSETLLMAGARLLRGGFPNLSLRRGRVTIDSLGQRSTKEISRAELELSPGARHLQAVGIRRLWLRAFFQRNDRTRSATGSTSLISDHSFVRLNGSAGNPLAWNVDWEDVWTHRTGGDSRGVSRRQAIDMSLQSQPHSALDAFLNWESARDIAWREEGGTGGFGTRRQMTANAHIYPGRLLQDLTPLTLRVDVGRSGDEQGQAGDDLPGGSSLWNTPDAPQQNRRRFDVLETRVQILTWLRLIDRLEDSRARGHSPEEHSDVRTRRFENRIEIRPRGGLLTLRAVTDRREKLHLSDSLTASEQETRRLAAEWSQTWGHGILTYCSFEAKRTHDHAHSLPVHRWAPLLRATYRRSRLHIDASLGISYAYEEEFAPTGTTTDARVDKRTIAIDSSISFQPLRILTLKVEHQVVRHVRDSTEQTLDVRLIVRA